MNTSTNQGGQNNNDKRKTSNNDPECRLEYVVSTSEIIYLFYILFMLLKMLLTIQCEL